MKVNVHTVLFLIVILLISCRKDKTPCNVTAGQTESMQVFDYHAFVFAYPNGSGSQQFHYLDIDNDDIDDLKITSQRDSIFLPFLDNKLYVKIEMMNGDVSVPEIELSGERYIVPADTVIDNSNSYPLIIYKRNVVCSFDPDSLAKITMGNSARYLFSGQCIDDDSYSWSNAQDHISLYKNSYEYRKYYGLSTTGDTVIYEQIFSPELCVPLPQNTLFYLPFKKIYGVSAKYGWIELKLMDNTVEFTRIAIQN